MIDEPRVTLRPEEMPPSGMYHLLNAAIAPRPIAWISSLASDGTVNLAPHSYTTVLSPDPPIVCFVSIRPKDTLRNVRATGDFVYNIADEQLGERLNLSAADFPPDISEVAWAGLHTMASEVVRTPRIVEAPISFECRLVQIVQIQETSNYLVMGEIVRGHIAERVMTDGRIDPAKLHAIGRLAGSQFSRLGELFKMERPTYRGLIEAGTKPLPEAG